MPLVSRRCNVGNPSTALRYLGEIKCQWTKFCVMIHALYNIICISIDFLLLLIFFVVAVFACFSIVNI